jgi:hypothetical protein
MVNPGVFHSLRLEFLVGEKPKYSGAVKEECVKDVLSSIQQRFFKRFPVDLPLDEDPSPEHLASVNDDDADPEIPEPDKEKLNPEEYKVALAQLEIRKALVTKRKGVMWLVFI